MTPDEAFAAMKEQRQRLFGVITTRTDISAEAKDALLRAFSGYMAASIKYTEALAVGR